MKEKDIVATTHPEFYELKRKRDIYRDVCAGTLTLREKHKEYLPKFPAETDEDYKFRIETSTLFNITLKTRAMMTGLVFKDSIELSGDVPDEIVRLWENIDNSGTHGDVFCRQLFETSFDGYSAILVDAPAVIASSREEQEQLGLRPYWVIYTADNIWNWQYHINEVSKRKELSLIVLREVTLEKAGEYTSETAVRFRVFRLIDGVVSWELYREEESSEGQKLEYILEQSGTLPTLTQIPVAIVSHLGNEPLLLDIAVKNIEHYQTYSDYKTLIHKTCVPIPVGKGVELGGGGQIVVGASTMIQTSADGGFSFAEVGGSSLNLTRQSLQDNRDDISLMGLSLLADKTARVDITATEALLNNVAETSELRMFARQLQDAIELALGHTAEYLGLERVAGGSVELGTVWKSADDVFNTQLDELNKRADIANKLQDFLPLSWIIRFIGVTNEDEIRELQEQVKAEIPLIFDEPLMPEPEPEPEQPAVPKVEEVADLNDEEDEENTD